MRRIYKTFPCVFGLLMISTTCLCDMSFERQVLIEYSLGNVSSVIPCDYDNDGDIDILALHYIGIYEYDLYLYVMNNNSLTATYITTINELLNFQGRDDFDSDGDLDIVALKDHLSGNKSFVFIRNDGEGSFALTELDISIYANSLDIEDVDSDGDKDIVFCGGYEMLYLENTDGFYTFIQNTLVLNWDFNFESGTIDYFDYDSDGDLDLILPQDPASSGFYIMENNGDMTFEVFQVSQPGVFEIGGAELFDVDSDSDLDIVTGGTNSGLNYSLSWWENENNYFTERNVTEDPWESYPMIIDFGDFDSDFDIDIVSSNRAGYGISIFENDGNQSYFEHTDFEGYYGGNESYVLDFDDDGDLDFLITGSVLYLFTNNLYSSVSEVDSLKIFEILSVYPNPFNASANICVVTQKGGNLELSLFNLLGQQVQTITNEFYSPGKHFFSLDGNKLLSGTYFIQAKTNSGDNFIRKIIVLK